jgi:hypothetical protein
MSQRVSSHTALQYTALHYAMSHTKPIHAHAHAHAHAHGFELGLGPDARTNLVNSMTHDELCSTMNTNKIYFNLDDSDVELRYTLLKNGGNIPYNELALVLDKSHTRQAGTLGRFDANSKPTPGTRQGLRSASASAHAHAHAPAHAPVPAPAPAHTPAHVIDSSVAAAMASVGVPSANRHIVSGIISALVTAVYTPIPNQETITTLTNAANELVGRDGMSIIAPNGLLRTPTEMAAVAESPLEDCPGAPSRIKSLVLPAVATIARSIIALAIAAISAVGVANSMQFVCNHTTPELRNDLRVLTSTVGVPIALLAMAHDALTPFTYGATVVASETDRARHEKIERARIDERRRFIDARADLEQLASDDAADRYNF